MSQAYDETPSAEKLLKEIKELREREAYYKNIIDSANKGIWVINNDYKTVYINYRMAEMLGTTIDEAMGTTVLKFLDDENWHTFMDVLSRCREGCKEQFDIKLRRTDGRELWALAGLVPFFDRQGFRIGVSGTFVDITERKRMEMALKESKDNLLKAQHVGRMGSWVRDLKTNMIETSGEMSEILGVKIAPMTVEDVSKMIYSPEEWERIQRISQEAIEKFGSFKTDVRMVRPDGKEIYCDLEAEVVKDNLGHPVKIVGILQDITERKKIELALRESRAQSELLIDLISHDIGNTNQAILGYLELACDRLAPSEKDRELLATPMQIINDSSQLISDVRKLRRVVSKEITVKMVDTVSVLSEAIADLPQVKGRDVRINFEPANACPVMANELLKDAFSHIIMNSIKHSSDSLTINVGLREVQENGKGYCRVEFEDNGPGIPDEVKKKLLTDIQETEDKKSRIGLGLRFVKTLVDTYHGKVWMEDRVAGDYRKGVRVIVMLHMAE
jgi:PAS domain S-box-containing protein